VGWELGAQDCVSVGGDVLGMKEGKDVGKITGAVVSDCDGKTEGSDEDPTIAT
jgi:hypothetical protein